VLDVVELGELAPVLRDGEGLELVQCLAAEVRTIDEEEDSLRASIADESIRDVCGCVGLSGAGGHLNECARSPFGE